MTEYPRSNVTVFPAGAMRPRYPALYGQPVTEADARLCELTGHATHTLDGRATGTCPRCGDVLDPVQP